MKATLGDTVNSYTMLLTELHHLQKGETEFWGPEQSALLPVLILSMKTTNRTGDKGQPWWRTTSTQNVFG